MYVVKHTRHVGTSSPARHGPQHVWQPQLAGLRASSAACGAGILKHHCMWWPSASALHRGNDDVHADGNRAGTSLLNGWQRWLLRFCMSNPSADTNAHVNTLQHPACPSTTALPQAPLAAASSGSMLHDAASSKVHLQQPAAAQHTETGVQTSLEDSKCLSVCVDSVASAASSDSSVDEPVLMSVVWDGPPCQISTSNAADVDAFRVLDSQSDFNDDWRAQWQIPSKVQAA